MDQAQSDDRNQRGSVSPEGQRPLSEESVATELSPEERRELLVQEYCQHYKVLAALYLSPLKNSWSPKSLEPSAGVIEDVLSGKFSNDGHDTSSLFGEINRQFGTLKDSVIDRVTGSTQQNEGFQHNHFEYYDYLYSNGFEESLPYHPIMSSPTAFPERIRESVKSLATTSVAREQIYHSVIQSVVVIAELIQDVDPRGNVGERLWLWLEDPVYADQHMHFIFRKALSDLEFLENFPHVMGQNLVSIPGKDSIEKERFPSEWIDAIPGYCGATTPTFAYRDFGWGLGVSTHFDMVLD